MRSEASSCEAPAAAAATDPAAAQPTTTGAEATAAAVASHARALGIDMPIAAAVAAVCHDGADLDEAIRGLLSRPFRPETA